MKDKLKGYSNTRKVKGVEFTLSAMNMTRLNICFP